MSALPGAGHEEGTWIRAITLAATAVTVCAISACEGRETVSSARALPTSSSSAASTTESPSSSVPPPPPTTAAPASSSSQPTESTAPTSASSESPAAAERLGVTTDPRLGPIVTDLGGMTVYRLEADGTPGFTPVLVPEGARVEVEGIDPALVGAVRQPDGGMQLTLAGDPLYRFTGDAAPGDTNGHGTNGGFAITPSGKRAGATR